MSTGLIDQIMDYLADNSDIADLIKVVYSTQAISGTLNAGAGGSVTVSVDVPTGYSILAHVACWNSGVVGMMCSFDAYTTNATLYPYQYNASSTTKSRGTVHVLTLCIKDM